MNGTSLPRYIAIFAGLYVLAIVLIGALAAAFPDMLGRPGIGPLLVVRVLAAQCTYFFFAQRTGRLLDRREFWVVTLGSYAVCLILEVGFYFVTYLGGGYAGESPSSVIGIMVFGSLLELTAIAFGYSPFIGKRVLNWVEKAKSKATR